MNDDRTLIERTQNVRFVRWQGLAIAQFTVAIALISGLSVFAIGAGLGLLQNGDFTRIGAHSLAFALALLCFFIVLFLVLLAVISRTLDLRLTARKVRGRTDLTFLGLNDRQLGRVSWGSFWIAALVFIVGSGLFLVSIGFYFVPKLLCGH